MSDGLSARQRWAHIAVGLQQDLAAYAALQALMDEQFHAALRHDAAAMQDVAQRITAQAQALEQSTQQRVLHAQALLPVGAPVTMTALFAQLQAPLQQQFLRLWRELEALVQRCKTRNVRNCQLILEQAQIMRQVLGASNQDEAIYGPG